MSYGVFIGEVLIRNKRALDMITVFCIQKKKDIRGLDSYHAIAVCSQTDGYVNFESKKLLIFLTQSIRKG
eukprot:snap_masked-scaffold_18-processed-gene-0.18-mRNA-1 protein AED:1.00 eAED:1.00 QI:0/0/0/0/1/1/2/0/69